MKIRSGFVSNSSSSSFVMFVQKEDYDKVFETLDDLEKDIIKHINPREVNAFGKKLIKIGCISGNYSSFEDYNYDGDLTEEQKDYLENDGPDCIMDNIIEKLNNFEYLSHSQDM